MRALKFIHEKQKTRIHIKAYNTTHRKHLRVSQHEVEAWQRDTQSQSRLARISKIARTLKERANA